MAKTIFCKQGDHWNEDIAVNGKLYRIDDKGHVVDKDSPGAELPADVEAKLLAKPMMFVDMDDPAFAARPRPKSRPQPILEEKHTGRVLSDEETKQVVGDDAAEPEKAPSAWPEVSLATPKPKLLDVLHRLKLAKAKVDYNDKMTKAEMLEQIERAYDKMV